MAAGTFTLTNAGLLDLLDGTHDWITGNKYAILVDNAHGAPSATETTVNDATDTGTNECASGDYSPVDVATETCTGGSGTVVFDSAIISYGATVTISARYLYIVQGTAAGKTGTDVLIGFVDLNDGGGANVSSSSGAFEVDASASNGWFTIS